MTRKGILGIAVVCALALSAYVAANASAADQAWGCGPGKSTESTALDWQDAHCTVRSTNEENEKFHTGWIEKGKPTPVSTTNAETASETKAAAPSKLQATIAGVATEVQCTGVGGSGSLTNAEESVSGTGTIEYSGCTVTKPAGKGCVVTGGKITTKELSLTTVGQSEGNLQLSPASGTEIASVPIEKCSLEGLNNKFPVTGSVTATAVGAVFGTTHAGVTAQNTLKLGGNKAGIEGSLTLNEKEGEARIVLMKHP